MKNLKRALSILLVATLIMAVATACEKKEPNDEDRNRGGTGDSTNSDSTNAEEIINEYEPYDESLGLDENGYLEGITARDYVEDFDYIGIEVPENLREISDSDVEAAYEQQWQSFFPKEEGRITDRKVQNEDVVNIDFVGSVDGVEFEGGNTRDGNTNGYNVIAGSDDFVDDFLTQIIGHSPGDTFDVNVTFPEDYGNEDLNGKDAVFVVEINYIVDVDALKEEIRESLSKNAVNQFVMDYISEIPAEVPDSFVKILEENTTRYYAQDAYNNGVNLDAYISANFGFDSLDELLADERDGLMKHARTQLVVQSIAEDLNLTVSDDDVRVFLTENNMDVEGSLARYPMPYLKQVCIHDAVLKKLVEGVVFVEGPAEEEGDETGEAEESGTGRR